MVLMISMVLMVPVVTRLMAVVSKLSMFRLSWRWSWWLRWSRWSRWSPGGWRWSFSAAGDWTGWPAWSSRSPTSASWRWPGSLRALRLGLLQTHEPLKWIFQGTVVVNDGQMNIVRDDFLDRKYSQSKAKKRKKIPPNEKPPAQGWSKEGRLSAPVVVECISIIYHSITQPVGGIIWVDICVMRCKLKKSTEYLEHIWKTAPQLCRELRHTNR